MFLKRIRVSGFKSFADPVDFDFGPGVTCIVGPNGCGKSNILDALKWVLGTQSAKALRGRQMSDMIFNGSSTRRASSVAQVDLVFNNEDRTLPLDQDEVSVTRKLYRSGESEYLINQHIVRLKDVREQFMDTGVGVDAYSVVEQGRVDSLLQSSPVDRRIIFEEAAGISKYKARRREAERKLERTQQNLLRVADIIDEIAKRLRSVKLQAGKARTFKVHEARLNELRSTFVMAEYHRFTQKIDKLTGESRQCEDQVTEIRSDIGRREAGESQLLTRGDRLAEEINEADGEFVRAKSELLAQEERIDAAQRRAEEQRSHLDRAAERQATDLRRREQSMEELAELEGSALNLDEQYREATEEIDRLMERDRSLARQFTDAQAALEDEKAGIIELLRKSAQMRNEIIRLSTHRESLVAQKGRLSERDAVVGGEMSAAMEEKAGLERRLVELDSVLVEQSRTLEEKQAEAARINGVLEQLGEELGQAKERRSALESRREVLDDLHRRREGVGAAARRLLDRKAQGESAPALEQVEGLVADILDVDVDHALVVEAALGEAAQHVVIRNGRAITDFPEEFCDLPGRLTALCLDRVPPIVNERDFSEQEGFVVRAIDLVQYPERFEQLTRHLLGKTIVVANLETALAMASSDVEGHRFVTEKGEVVEADMRVRLGPLTSGDGLISRKSELRDIESQVVGVVERIRTLEDQLNRTQAERGHLDDLQHELRTASYECGTTRAEVSTAVEGVNERISRLAKEQPVIAQEVSVIDAQANEVLEKCEQEGKTLERIEAENKESENRVRMEQERIDQLVDERRGVQESLTDGKVSVGQLSEKRAAASEAMEGCRRAQAELESSIDDAKHDVEQCEARIVEASQTATEGRKRLADLATGIGSLESKCATLRRDREAVREEMEKLGEFIRSSRGRLETVEAELHDREMALAEVKVRRDDIVSRVLEELEIDLAECYEEYEYQEQDWEKVETEIAELRRKMDRLGNVNLDAIAELEDLETRHAFLAEQRDDLAESRRQLLQLIDRLNNESRERFRKTFDQIRENFRTLFRKLFGGGRADIVLEDPDDVLECGIEIFAQPPGKEVQAISLMSGGEKSLTAIALLMSIFKTRPAPFTILDEVDAALDEANNDRFNRIVQEFVSETQFIIITHSKWTMNMADHLYGITMQEPGVSARVSVEFSGVNVA